VHLTATLWENRRVVAAREVLERQLPLLAACLSHYDNSLHLTFRRKMTPPCWLVAVPTTVLASINPW
jgi:hypothetical protein